MSSSVGGGSVGNVDSFSTEGGELTVGVLSSSISCCSRTDGQGSSCVGVMRGVRSGNSSYE